MTTPTRILSLSLGASLAFEERSGNVRSARYAMHLIAAASVILGSALFARKQQWIEGGGVYWCFALLGYALLSRGILTAIIFGKQAWLSWPRTLLEWAPMRYIGRISYGLYIYHYLVLFALGLAPHLVAATGAEGVRVAAAIIITLLVAIVSYELLEKPLLRLRPRRDHVRVPLSAQAQR